MEKLVLFDTYFPTLVKDYLRGNPKTAPFYAQPPVWEGLHETVNRRKFSTEQRQVLTQVLEEQYRPFGKLPPAVKENLSALGQENTFTVTTGHQIAC